MTYMDIKTEAAFIEREARAVINSPSALIIPSNIRSLIVNLVHIVSKMAVELEKLKGADDRG